MNWTLIVALSFLKGVHASRCNLELLCLPQYYVIQKETTARLCLACPIKKGFWIAWFGKRLRRVAAKPHCNRQTHGLVQYYRQLLYIHYRVKSNEIRGDVMNSRTQAAKPIHKEYKNTLAQSENVYYWERPGDHGGSLNETNQLYSNSEKATKLHIRDY